MSAAAKDSSALDRNTTAGRGAVLAQYEAEIDGRQQEAITKQS